MNLSDRLAKAAHDRRRQHEAATRGVEVAPIASFAPEEIDFDSVPTYVPEHFVDRIDADHLEPMKMVLPEMHDATAVTETGPLPLWERPLADVLRDQPLATVTQLPIVPREYDSIDDELDGVFAEPIPMRGEWVVPEVDIDLDELHVPPLAAFEAEGLASGALQTEHMYVSAPEDVIDLDDVVDAEMVIDLVDSDIIDLDDDTVDAEIVDESSVIDLDDVTIDAEIVEPTSADMLLEQWSAGVSAYAQDRQEKVDGLYKRLVDAAQRPRITFGPLDLRDGVTNVATEHQCPQCGSTARIDIHDPVRGRIHLSCDSCFKMWQEKVESTVDIDEPYMRD